MVEYLLTHLRQCYYAAQMTYEVYWCSPEYQDKWKHIELNTDQSHPQTRLNENDYLKG